MSTQRLRWRIFTKGWWGTGARDAQPQGTLRRALGIAQIKTSELRSRNGSTVIATLDAHSVCRFANRRYAGVLDKLYVDGATIVRAGLDGTKLTFVPMSPTLAVEDYLFVAGGGHLFKVSPDGVASQWGIDPPPDGFAAAGGAAEFLVIDALDVAAGWTAMPGGAACTVADEGTIKQEGANSMKMTVAASTVGTATKVIAIDLSAFGVGVASPDEDFISVWVRVDTPTNVKRMQLSFDVAAGNFAADYYVRDVVPTETQPGPGQLNTQTQGIAGYVFSPNAGETVAVYGPEVPGGPPRLFTISPDGGIGRQVTDPAVLADLQAGHGQSTVPSSLDTWTLLRLPKSTFARVGGGAGSWATVAAVRFTVETNAGPATIYWDDLKLHGGVGLQGTYKYQVTYLNDATGTRSNGNPTEVTVTYVMRGAVTLTNLPVATDPQVTHLEVFRTVGNGTLKFRVAKLPIGTTTWVDTVADVATLDSRPGIPLMSDIELDLDNLRPQDNWDSAFGPLNGRMFYIRSPQPGEKGALFYSPPGRAESVSGYLVVTGDEEPLLAGVVFNGTGYVWSTAGIYQLQGDPPAAKRVFGCPGTLWPLSIALTPYGVAYLALDGPRLFSGTESKLIAPEAVNLLFRNEPVEDIFFLT